MKWRIVGADKETANDIVRLFDANSEDEAVGLAQANGMLVESCSAIPGQVRRTRSLIPSMVVTIITILALIGTVISLRFISLKPNIVPPTLARSKPDLRSSTYSLTIKIKTADGANLLPASNCLTYLIAVNKTEQADQYLNEYMDELNPKMSEALKVMYELLKVHEGLLEVYRRTYPSDTSDPDSETLINRLKHADNAETGDRLLEAVKQQNDVAIGKIKIYLESLAYQRRILDQRFSSVGSISNKSDVVGYSQLSSIPAGSYTVYTISGDTNPSSIYLTFSSLLCLG